MFQKDWRIGLLLDFYGEALGEHARTVLTLYYDNDLSLAEIAEGEGISRQGIRHIIKKGEEQLFFLEEKLGLFAADIARRKDAEALLSLAEACADISDQRVAALVSAVRETADRILSKE